MFFEGEFDDKIKEVNDYWGDNMPLMACEELGECIRAISKMEREGDVGTFVMEMGDAFISLIALCNRYHVSDIRIYNYVNEKLSKKY